MRARYKIIFCAISYWLIVMGLAGCQHRRLYKDNRIMMGTFIEVRSGDPRASAIVFAEIKRIEGLLNKYDPESEIWELNKNGYLKASPDTFYIIKKAKELWRLSAGAFDITVGPLVDLWGFTDKKHVLPGENNIKKALKLVGSDKIILNENDNMIKFKFSGMKIDLGAVAKGYAVDCAVKKLKESGIKSCLINAGGQIYALGDKFAKPWRIAVRSSREDGFNGYLELRDKAASTSGDYRQYFIAGAKKYAHIIDPKTGYPADSGISSVTVIADDGLTADALSTAIFILGGQKGRELARKFPAVEVKIEGQGQ